MISISTWIIYQKHNEICYLSWGHNSLSCTILWGQIPRVPLHTTEPTCTQPNIVQHTTAHWCPVVCHHFKEHDCRRRRYKRLFFKQIPGLQHMSNLNAQFAVCDCPHISFHIICSIMNKNRKINIKSLNTNSVEFFISISFSWFIAVQDLLVGHTHWAHNRA